jgi:hypothetical protein
MGEWRVFIPELHADDHWIPPTMRDSYAACMTRLLAAMRLMTQGDEPEEREDAYTVASDFVGLKLRVRAAHSTALRMCLFCVLRASFCLTLWLMWVRRGEGLR